MGFHVYVVRSEDGRAYIGKTSDLARRLRQHNGELSGGARATRGRRWRYELVIDGFETGPQALQAEWRLKRERRREGGRCPVGWLRSAGEHGLAAGHGWTSNAPGPWEQQLCVRTVLAGEAPGSWPVQWGWEEL